MARLRPSTPCTAENGSLGRSQLLKNRIDVQLIRFAVVGLGSNGLLFALYLGSTTWGLGHKTAMTLLYAVGVLQTFLFNRRWSFGHDGPATPALLRYVAAYALGYAVNYGVLVILVDRWGLPHQWVQFFMVGILALMLFMLQRHWVFRQASQRTAPGKP